MTNNIPMTETPRSTTLARFGYDADAQKLTVSFRDLDGNDEIVTGIYHEVPVDLAKLLANANTNGGSVGRVLNESIRTRFRFERIAG
jgi:hypothetical protein